MDISINLLQKKKNYARIETIFRIGRYVIFVLGICVLGSLMTIFFLLYTVQDSYDKKLDEKEKLMTQLAQLQERESEILLINKKARSMFDVIDSSIKFDEMYKVFEDQLPVASEAGSLSSIKMNSKYEIDAQINFPDVLAMSRFLTIIEEEKFRKHYEYIKLDGISLSQKKDDSRSFVLQLHLKAHENKN